MKRLIVCVAVLAALAPVSALAASAPDPATLRATLAGAPSTDYVEADTGSNFDGPFDANGYANANLTDPAKRSALVLRLNLLGFKGGYGRLWVKTGANIGLVEQVMAFGDHSGAVSYFGSSKLADLADPRYKGSTDTSSIPDSYGVNDVQNGGFSTAVIFTKGNDLFAVAYFSTAAYLDTEVLTQAQAEYAFAPANSVQPQSAAATISKSVSSGVIALAAGAGVVVLLLIVGGVVFLLLRSRRPAAIPVPLAAPMQQGVSFSPDGRYWWDGASWQDAMSVAPANAPRSPDGGYWWDGQAWRPMPR